MPNVVLSSAVRSNVLQLQNTEKNQGIIQNRLATGLKVSTALDDPRNFFQAQGLNFRANDLGRLLDGMGLGIKTIEAADKGITGMTKVAENMAAITKAAQDATTAAERTTLLDQFNELRAQLINLAEDSNFNGLNLLGGDDLTVTFNEDASNEMDVDAVDWTAGGANEAIDIAAGADWTADAAGDTNIGNAATAVNAAISTLRTQAASFGTSLTTIKIREDFTNQMVNTLKGGADGLTLADQNEEAANLLALNTRQQLSQQALSLATQSEQSILRLLG